MILKYIQLKTLVTPRHRKKYPEGEYPDDLFAEHLEMLEPNPILTEMLCVVAVLWSAWFYSLGVDSPKCRELVPLGLYSGVDWYKLVSASMLHTTVPHLALNIGALCMFGRTAEQLWGKFAYLTFFVFGSFCTMMLLRSEGFFPAGCGSGASCGIMTLIGCLCGYRVGSGRKRISPTLKIFLISAVSCEISYDLSVWFGGQSDRASKIAIHLVPLLIGIILSFIVPARTERRFRQSHVSVLLALWVLLIGITVVFHIS